MPIPLALSQSSSQTPSSEWWHFSAERKAMCEHDVQHGYNYFNFNKGVYADLQMKIGAGRLLLPGDALIFPNEIWGDGVWHNLVGSYYARAVTGLSDRSLGRYRNAGFIPSTSLFGQHLYWQCEVDKFARWVN